MEIHLRGTWAEIKAQIAEIIHPAEIIDARPEFPEQVETLAREDGAAVTKQMDNVVHAGAGQLQPPMTTPAPPPVVTEPAPPVTAPPVAAGPELDSAGYPWDSRIHASTKSKIVNGMWKMKRGVAPEMVNPVQAEFKAPAAGVAPPAAAAPAPTGAPSTMEAFVAYLNKIDASKVANFVDIQQFLESILGAGLNLAAIPAEQFPALAEQVRTQFQTEF